MKKMRILLVVTFICCCICFGSVAEIVASGTCGDNLTWKLDNEGKLTVSGMGAMTDYALYTDTPWYSFQSSILSVEIQAGVTSIGKYAFYDCQNLQSVTSEGDKLQIGIAAFSKCSAIESVTLEGTVSSIGESAFQGLTNLKSLKISGSNLQIGSFAFIQSGLESVTLEGSVSSIGKSAFQGLTNLKSIRIPGSDLQIEKDAFYLSGLESVTLEGSVSSIGEGAFFGLTNLKSIKIPGSNLRIEKEAFYQSGLESVTLEGSVSSIAEYAFYLCTNLQHIWYCGMEDKWNSIPKGDYWAPSGTTEFHYFSFAGAGTETDAYIIETNTDWNTLAVFIEKGSFDTTEKHFLLDVDDTLSVSTMIGTKENPFKGIFDGNGKTLTFTVKDYSPYTAPFAYIKSADIRNLHVAGSITGMNKSRASGLIGENYGSSTVTNCCVSVEISGSAYIGGLCIGAGDALNLTGCVFDGKINASSKSGGFVGWGTKGLNITDCVFAPREGSSINGGTFYYNGGGEGTLRNCYYLTPAGTPQGKLAHSVATAEDVTFDKGTGKTYTFSGITAYEFGLEYKGQYCIGKDDELRLSTTKEAPEGCYLRYVDQNGTPLARGTGLTWLLPDLDVTISAEFSAIEPYGRPTFRLPAEIESIGEDAFERIKADVVYVPDTCKKIEAYAFRNCPNLKQIRLPENCEINDAAFYGCTELMAIYSSGDGTTKDWAEENGYGYMTAK